MSDRAQIESDEAFARRLQEEEMGGRMSFGNSDSVVQDTDPAARAQRATDTPTGFPDNIFGGLPLGQFGPQFGRTFDPQQLMQQHQQIHRQHHQQNLREHHQRHQQQVQQQQQQRRELTQQQQQQQQPPIQPIPQAPTGVPFVRGGADFSTDRMISELFRSIAEPSTGMRTALTGLEAAVTGDFPGRSYTEGAGGDEAPRAGTRSAPEAGGARRGHTRATGGASGGAAGVPGLLGSMVDMIANASGASGGFTGASFTIGPGETVQFETTGGMMGGNGGGGAGGARTRGQGTGTGGGQGNPAADMLGMLFTGMRGGTIEGELGDMLRTMLGGGVGQGGETYEDWLELMERMGGNVNRGASEQEISDLPTQQFRKADKAAAAGSEAETVAGPAAGPTAGSAAGSAAGPSASASAPAGSSGGGADAERGVEKCAICLGEYEDGDELKGLPCSHLFHSDCIGRWLKVNRTCPLCTQSIRPADD